MSVRDIATLIRSEQSRRWVEPFRDLHTIPTGGTTHLPRVNPMLPVLCFGSILKKCRQNDYTLERSFQPKVIRYNEVVLLEINRLESREEAWRLRDLAAELPQTLLAFVGYDGLSVRIVSAAPCHGGQVFYQAQLGMEVEMQESPTALCSLSHDPDCYVNPSATRSFIDTYRELSRRKDRPLKKVSQHMLLMWQTRHFMDTHYELRLNELTRQAEFRQRDFPGDTFRPLAKEDQNTMTIRALEAGLPSWDRDLDRFINSREIRQYNPVRDYLYHLSPWDGHDRITPLARRIPTDTPHWPDYFHTWMLAMVACWIGKDREHGNALVPLLTGYQGSGKTSFCRILLPPVLRPYYAENLNLKSETTLALALSSRALINIDEFDKYSRGQHPLLKFLISQNEVDMRLPFAAHMEQRRRFASFIATTNNSHPLVDPSGSRRYLCVNVTGPIDFLTPIDHDQVYAQLRDELRRGRRYWLNKTETTRLMEQNARFQEINTLEQMLLSCFRVPKLKPETWNFKPKTNEVTTTPTLLREGWGGSLLSLPEILSILQDRFPKFQPGRNILRDIGSSLTALKFPMKHKSSGNCYYVEERRPTNSRPTPALPE